MNGFWFAAMITGLLLAGVAAQLGWQLPTVPEVKQACGRVRSRSQRVGSRDG